MSDGGKGKKPIDLRHVKTKLLGGKRTTKPDLSMEITQEMRVKAANALGDMLKEHARQPFPTMFDVYTITMLHILVSIGMRNAAAENDESLMKVAGRFREIVSDLWLQLGMTQEDCRILNQDVIIMTPRTLEIKKL